MNLLRDDRQDEVLKWCARTFGDLVAHDLHERVARLVEEAIELAQAEGIDADKIHDLVGHVYSKPPGEPAQEVGGIGVTLLAYCELKGLSADDCEATEFARVLAIPAARFQQRQNAKAAAGVAMATDD